MKWLVIRMLRNTYFNKKNRKDPLSLVLDCLWIPAQHSRGAYLVGGVAT